MMPLISVTCPKDTVNVLFKVGKLSAEGSLNEK